MKHGIRVSAVEFGPAAMPLLDDGPQEKLDHALASESRMQPREVADAVLCMRTQGVAIGDFVTLPLTIDLRWTACEWSASTLRPAARIGELDAQVPLLPAARRPISRRHKLGDVVGQSSEQAYEALGKAGLNAECVEWIGSHAHFSHPRPDGRECPRRILPA